MKAISTLLTTGIFFVAQVSYAATVSNTEINMLMIERVHGPKIFIKTSIAKPTGNPACYTNTGWGFVLPLTTDTDKAIYSALLSAKSAGKKVNLVGTGECGSHSGIETLSRVDVL